MKKEKFTNGIEKFIIEEIAKHCHDTGQNVSDLMQNENLRSTIDIILNNSKKLFYQINTTNEEQKRDDKMPVYNKAKRFNSTPTRYGKIRKPKRKNRIAKQIEICNELQLVRKDIENGIKNLS